jgi:hypothetical protein
MGTVLVVSTKNLSHGWMNQGTQPQKALVPEEIECRARPSYLQEGLFCKNQPSNSFIT